MTSIADAKRNLYESLVTNSATGQPRSELALAARVYLNEPPPGQMAGPLAITVSTNSINPLEFHFAVRVYALLTTGALEQQRKADELTYALETFLAGTYPRLDWQWSYDPNLDALVIEADVPYPRNDF